MGPPLAFQPHMLSELDFWHWWADGQVQAVQEVLVDLRSASYELCDCRHYLPLFGYSGSLLSRKNIEIAIKREKRRQMNKSIFLLLYLVYTWSLIICTCCSDRGTAERNLIFSHFLCLQLFGLTGYTKTRVEYLSRSRDGSNQLEPLELGTLKLNGYCQGIT